jgi:hypothetical protein
MSEQPKSTPVVNDRLIAHLRKELENQDPSRRAWAIGEYCDLATLARETVVALLRGLNDPDSDLRYLAVKGFLLAFPIPEAVLSGLLRKIESDDPEVRLAAIDQLLILLPRVLASLSGRQATEQPPTSKQPDSAREDFMEYAGRWVAWTRDRQRILAVADSFADVMKKAMESGESDPYVKKAPGVSPENARKPFAILEDESPNIIDDVSKVFPDPDTWLDAPNSSLGGEKPRDLIRTGKEQEVRYLLRGIKDGITT